MKKLTILLNLMLLFVFGSAQQNNNVPKRTYTTTSIGDTTPPRIDGLLDDEAWQLTEWSGDYVEWSPNENTTPSQQTALKMLYNGKNIYVAFRCFDSAPDSIVNRLSRRDGFDGDWVEINISSLGDQRTAQSFTISVSGVKGEEYITNNGSNWDPTWNPIWYAKTNIDDEGWTAEIRIPLTQLRFGNQEIQNWTIQSTRRYFRKEERSVWQRSPQGAAGWVSSFGNLEGVKGVKPQKQLELQPYVVGALERYEAQPGNPFRDGSDTEFKAGLDGKMGITNDITLDFTVNPDFGQVEADPSAIALDGFQIFFPEQRPFFIENKNIFDYRFSRTGTAVNTYGFDNLFYSRRIGRAPQGFPSLNTTEFVDQPSVTSILGAAKISGKTSNGWSIGLLESITANEKAEISNGVTERNEIVEPLTNFMVARAQKDFNDNNTYVGGIFTSTNRNLPDNLDFLHKNAYTGGLDFQHQWKDRAYYINFNTVFSHITGSETAIQRTQQSLQHLFQRVDATHVEVDPSKTALTGTGGNLNHGKASGNWRYQAGATWRSPELELNDVGFQLRADDLRHYGWLGYRTTEPLKNLRQFLANYNHLAAWDFEGNLNHLLINVNTWLNMKNSAWFNLATAFEPVNYSVTDLRGGPRLKKPSVFSLSTIYNSDTRKKMRYGINFQSNWGGKNSLTNLSFTAPLTFQPTNALKIQLTPSFSNRKDELQYVATKAYNGDSRYLVGRVNQKTVSAPIRLDYILTPDLSIQYWGQPFISQGEFDRFKYISHASARNYNDRFVQLRGSQTSYNNQYEIDENLDGNVDYSFSNPDFSFVQFRSNLVGRWEYIPGSELFLVWSQDNSVYGLPQENLIDDLQNDLSDNKADNIFLLKATYRFIK